MGGINTCLLQEQNMKRKAEKRGFEKALEKRRIENSFDAINQNMWNQFDKINTEFDKRLLNIEEMLECRIKEIHNSINETRRRVGEIEEVIKHKTVK